MDLRVAAYAVIVDADQRMLLAHWNEAQHAAWTLPGGGLDPGESPERAAQREVTEETGYHAEIGDLLGIDSRVIPAERRLSRSATGPLHTLRIIYRARVTGGALSNEIGGSTDQAQWFPLDQVAGLKKVGLVEVGLTLAKIDLTALK